MNILNCDYCDKGLRRAVKVCLVVRDYRKTYAKSKRVFIQTEHKDLSDYITEALDLKVNEEVTT